jgi:ABC-type polysaccharide/polyol phosphate transport system ATPase subunit
MYCEAMMDDELVIQVESLTKVYNLYDRPIDRVKEALHPFRRKYHHDFYALRDLSFSIRRGEAFGIIGRNGSGKSTLLKILSGVLTPTTGRVQVKGRVSALLELGAGFNPEFTGLENVYLQGTLMGFERAEMEARIEGIQEFADIGEFIHQPVKHYSSGMFVRLAFSCAINVDPDILIVDEALAVGDVRFQVKCNRKFSEFREMNKTIILVSHSSADVVRLCDQALWLDGGKVRKAGASKRVVEEYLAWMVHDTGVQAAPDSGGDSGSSGVGGEGLIPIPRNALITGDGGAAINAVGLFSEDNRRLSIVQGPSTVRLVVRVTAQIPLENPYFAFQIVNSKGLRVMGSNTSVLDMTMPPLALGESVTVSFTFPFPEIENGHYLVAVGVADGSAENHIRHQFVADAYDFQFVSTSRLQKQDVLLKLPQCKIDIIGDPGGGHGPF